MFGFASNRNQRGTLGVVKQELVHIRYLTSGATAWVSPIVAKVAIDRGQAEKIKSDDNSEKK